MPTGGHTIYPNAGLQPPCGRTSGLSLWRSRAESSHNLSHGSGRSRYGIAEFESVPFGCDLVMWVAEAYTLYATNGIHR
jgi:hypothetical protein